MKRFYEWAGGRKQLNGYIFAVLTTAMALKLETTFEAYAMWLSVALLGTSALVMAEDVKRSKL